MKKLTATLFVLFALAVTAFADSGKKEINVDMVKIPGTDIEMLKTEVTQNLYESVMGVNPSHFRGADNPVESVSLYDAIYFCNKLSALHELTPVYAVDGESDVSKWEYEPNGDVNRYRKPKEVNGVITQNTDADGYRLPTMNEWMNAARGGESHKYAGSNRINKVAWYQKNSGDSTHPVAQKNPNGYGLFDMSGNVWEWLCDKDGSRRWYRIGGSWNDYLPEVCAVDYADSTFAASQDFDLGFRIVRRAK